MKTSNFIEWYRFAMGHIAYVDNVYHVNYPKYNVIYMLYAPNVFHFDEIFCNAIDLSVNHCKATECIVEINYFLTSVIHTSPAIFTHQVQSKCIPIHESYRHFCQIVFGKCFR